MTSRITAVEKLLAIAPLYASRPRGSPPLKQIVDQVAAQHGVSSGTIWRWYRKARSHGLAGLAHTRSDKGRSRFIAKHTAIEQMICDRISRGRSSFSIWKSLRLVLGSEAPSYPVVLAYVRGHYRTEGNLQRAA
jgi:hypothetical protein